jgi:hypothetical protein
LGLQNLVIETEYVALIRSGQPYKTGIIMDCARGLPFREFKALVAKTISPLFQLSLNNLMILDSICAQRDRPYVLKS